MPEQSNDYRVVVFGAGGVGKSSLVLRFVKGTFRESYIPTIEDTYRQVISCNKNICTLQITDTTGSHQFPAMQRLSISKAFKSSLGKYEEANPLTDKTAPNIHFYRLFNGPLNKFIMLIDQAEPIPPHVQKEAFSSKNTLFQSRLIFFLFNLLLPFLILGNLSYSYKITPDGFTMGKTNANKTAFFIVGNSQLIETEYSLSKSAFNKIVKKLGNAEVDLFASYLSNKCHRYISWKQDPGSCGHAFILVYSVCSRQSLEELKPIYEVIKELKGPDLSQIPIMLTGNKCDESAELREVTTSEGQAQASEWGVSFMETSAKTNHNVKQLFQELLNLEKSRNVSLNVGGKANSRVAKDKCEIM